jgi:hypothetical protein
MAHWFLLFGTGVEIIEPELLKTKMRSITKELHDHYNLQESMAQS